MLSRFVKFADTSSYLALVVLTWRFFAGDLHWKLAIAATVVSGAWLVVTAIRVTHLLKTFFDTLSRLELAIPLVLGSVLSVLALLDSTYVATRVVAGIELGGWALVYLLYRRNRSRFVKQGHGPLPADCWVSPPASVLQAGDLVLTSGQVATHLHETVGHGVLVIESPDGSKNAFSSYMNCGAVINPLDHYADEVRRHGHYIALRPRTALTREQVSSATQNAEEMLAENAVWRDKTNERRARVIRSLPLPKGAKKKLEAITRSSGYDWLGLFMGRLAPQRWTCVGACLELYQRIGVPTKPYGTGLMGVGTTLFDPIMPVRFLSDPYLHLLSVDDRNRSEPAVRNPEPTA